MPGGSRTSYILEKSFSPAQDPQSLGHKTHHCIIIQEHRQTLCSHDEASSHKIFDTSRDKNHLPEKELCCCNKAYSQNLRDGEFCSA